MLVELLKPAGAELARRWVAALLLAPADERAAIVEEVEARMAALYAGEEGEKGEGDGPLLDVRDEPRPREGFVEQVTRTYGKGAASSELERKSRGTAG